VGENALFQRFFKSAAWGAVLEITLGLRAEEAAKKYFSINLIDY